MDTQYTFGTSANAYYKGHDLRIRWDDRSLGVIVNEKDGMLAIDVKDHDTIHNTPLASQAAAEKIGDTETQHVYERVQMDFWQWAGEACKDYGFETVYQAGRSGGWLAVAGTENIPGSELIEPGEEDVDLRDRFLAFAFAIEQAIEGEGGYKQQFYAALVEAGEEHRDPVDCPNCGNAIDPRKPLDGHQPHCLLNVLLGVLMDRDHVPSEFDLTKIDPDILWDRFGGTAADWVAEQMGIPNYPSMGGEPEPNEEVGQNWETNEPIVEAEEPNELESKMRYEREQEEAEEPRFGEVELRPFVTDDDANFPDDTLYLYEVSDGVLFEDAEGRLFNRVGHGPVQGSVEIVDDDELHAYWDVTTRVRLHGPAPATFSKAAPRNVLEMRRVAGEIVAPHEAEDNKIALFAATGEVESGVAEAVRYHIKEDTEPVAFASDLADYLERVGG